MWKYVKLESDRVSPMAQVLSQCSSPTNIQLAVYEVEAGHLECAATPEHEKLALGNVASAIKEDCGHPHVVLAYDMEAGNVYRIEDVPELNVASALLIAVTTEMLHMVHDGGPGLSKNAVVRKPANRVVPKPGERPDSGFYWIRYPYDNGEGPTPSVQGPAMPQLDESITSGKRFRLGRWK